MLRFGSFTLSRPPKNWVKVPYFPCNRKSPLLMSDSQFTHLDAEGRPHMVDVAPKAVTARSAVARSVVQLDAAVIDKLEQEDFHTKKGPVFHTAVLAGIMAAKKTSDLIPLCHPLGLDNCSVDIRLTEQREIEILCTARLTAKTGVEMEALTGASVAALTIYDMCKSFSQNIVIRETRLLLKTGGKSDYEAA